MAMRTFVCCFCASLSFLTFATGAGASGSVAGRLESVSILDAGAGSSVAVRTSSSAALVATTAADPRTAVIELVGIATERRDVAVKDASGMISRIAIDTVPQAASGMVTRIRVSLTRSFRRRVRISGNVVYVDFEPGEPALRVAAFEKRPESLSAKAPKTTPVPIAEKGRESFAAKLARMTTAPFTAERERESFSANAPKTTPVPLTNFSRWLAITEPLQHAVNPSSTPPVLARSWMPVILKDGAIIYGYGEYAHVDDQVTLLLPFDDSDTPAVEAVSLPRSAVDLDATAQASESVRGARYIATSGPRDFAELARDVSAALNTVPDQRDALARVAVIEGVRRRLMEWPASHFGYRAADVHEAVTQLDPLLIQYRAAAGVSRVDLSLVAPTATPPAPVVFRRPTLIDLIENAMRLVGVMRVPAERASVLRTTAAALDRHRAELPAVWLATGERRVADALKTTLQTDAAYRDLSAGLIARAMRAAAEGNVRTDRKSVV